MKYFRFLPIALLLTLSLDAHAAPADSPSPETQIRPGLATTGGRFQLFQSLITINAQGAAFSALGVFKINTVTGRVWKYEEGQTKDGKFYKWWSPIEQALNPDAANSAAPIS